MTGADTISGADQPCEGRRVRARAGVGFSLAGALGLSVVSSATAIFISPAVIDVDDQGHYLPELSNQPGRADLSPTCRKAISHTGWSAIRVSLQGVGPSRQNRPRFVAFTGDTFPGRSS